MLEGEAFADHLLDHNRCLIGVALKPQRANQGDLSGQSLVVLETDDMRPLRRRGGGPPHPPRSSGRFCANPPVVKGISCPPPPAPTSPCSSPPRPAAGRAAC